MKESAKAKTAWADYLGMGPGRSLEKLHRLYQVRQSNGETTVPSVTLRSLEQWSSDFRWQERLQAIVDEEARIAAEKEAEYRREIMETGYATAHERVKLLNRLAGGIVNDLRITDGDDSDPRFWLKDVKGIGGGDDFERVEMERFNAEEITQLRGTLDDIAKEVGGRKQKTELTGKDGGPISLTWADIAKAASDDADA